MSISKSEFMVQNKAFLDLATQFGFIQRKNIEDASVESSSSSDIISEEGENKSIEATTESEKGEHEHEKKNDLGEFNEVILKLLHVQEEIGKLKMKEKQCELSEQYQGLTNPSSMSWLLSSLENVSSNLRFIVDNSAKIQLKLANPIISNSLPLHSSLHQPLVDLTSLLHEVKAASDRCAKASSWLEGQNWEVVSKQLVASRHGTETLAARLNTAANRIQLFRENIVMSCEL